MKRTLITALAALICFGAMAQTPYTPSEDNLKARQEFADSKFGIFLHWGLYSMFAQGEWYLSKGHLSHQEYKKSADAFYPHRFDAKAWVKAIKDSGAKYICLTSRHHDGFSMWNTKYSEYDIVDATPYKRDIMKELSRECKRQGIKLHLYYSHADWGRSDYFPSKSSNRVTEKDHFEGGYESYFKFMNNQLVELLTKYDITALWFDGMWDRRSANWRIREQYDLIHSVQPSCLIGNNHHLPAIEGEDFQIFERDLPGENKAGFSKGQTVSHKLPLETCQTMNGMWGYKVADQNYKSTAELIRLLVQTSGKGANLLLNVGPQPDGTLPETALSRLAEMGKWLEANGETIYGTQAGGYIEGDTLTTTRKDNRLFIHVLSDKVTRIDMPLEGKVKRVIDFSQKSPLKYKFGKGRLTMDVAVPADVADYIIEVELK